jgi:hypothetical protein
MPGNSEGIMEGQWWFGEGFYSTGGGYPADRKAADGSVDQKPLISWNYNILSAKTGC